MECNDDEVHSYHLAETLRGIASKMSFTEYECDHTMLLDVEEFKCTRLELMFMLKGCECTNVRIILKMQVVLQFTQNLLNKCKPNIKAYLEEEFLYVDGCRIFLKEKINSTR